VKVAATIARSLQADMQAELRDLERAVAIGTRDAGRGVKTELRRQAGSAGLSQRLANSWRDRHYPNQKLAAARCGSLIAADNARPFGCDACPCRLCGSLRGRRQAAASWRSGRGAPM
jgi:hypothetical protein